MAKDMVFSYEKVELLEVVDGDTLTLRIDLGFSTFHVITVRLNGIDTPEDRTINLLQKRAGLYAKTIVKELMSNKAIKLTTYKDDTEKYGRYLGEIVLSDSETEFSLNDFLLINKLARKYSGEKKQPWTEIELNTILDFKLN